MRFLRGVCQIRTALVCALATFLFPSSARAQGSIAGSVTAEAGGAPLVGMTVQLEQYNGPYVASQLTDSGGSYAFASLSDGVYVVRVLSGGGYVGELYDNVNEFDYDLARPLTISGGSAIASADFALAAAGSISGTVFGAGGASVNVRIEDAASRRFRGSANSDGGSGAYTVPNLPPGQYRICFHPYGTNLAIQYYNGRDLFRLGDGVAVALGANVAGKDATLAVGTSISGTIAVPGPDSPELLWVEAHDAVSDDWFNGTQPSVGGTYTISNLPEGSYVVKVQTWSTHYVQEYYSSSGADVSSFAEATPVPTTVAAPASGINLTLEVGRTLSGHVFLDANGNGTQDSGEPNVVNAQINASPETGCCGSGTRTDAAGDYFILGLRAGRYSVNATSTSPDQPFVQETYDGRNFLTGGQDLVDLSSGDGVANFSVEPGQLIEGLVFQDLNGNGVRDAGEPGLAGNGQVRALEAATNQCCSHAQVGADGRYALAVPAGTYRVQANVYSSTLLSEYWQNVFFQNQATEITPPATGIDFSLIDGALYGTLRGRVVRNGTTTGIPGVDVSAQLYSSGEWVAGTSTLSDGSFVIANLPSADYRVLFDTRQANTTNNADFVAEYWNRCQSQSCPPGQINTDDTRVVFPAVPAISPPGADLGTFGLTQGGSLSGTVDIQGGGTLPAGLSVQVQNIQGAGPLQPFLPGASVGSGGQYRVRGLPAPSTYRVQLNTSGSDYVPVYYQSASLSTPDANQAGAVSVDTGSDTPGIDLHTFVGGSISGHVTCAANGSDIPGLWISVDAGSFHAGARTDVFGRYRVRGVPTGSYTVRTGSRGEPLGSCGSVANAYQTGIAVTAPSDTPNVDFTLGPGTTIGGRVTQLVDGVPQPVVNFRVSASEYASGQFVSDGRTDANGDYSIGGLAIGASYQVKAEVRDSPDDPQFFNFIQEWWNDKRSSSEADPVAAPATGKDFVLDLGGAISGTVVADATGLPILDVSVCTRPYAGAGFTNCDSTDHNGFYIVRGLPAGEFRVDANGGADYVFEYYDNSPSYNFATPVAVAASTPANPVPVTTGINFGLAQGQRIQGRIFFDTNDNGLQDVGEPGVPACVNAQSSDGLIGLGSCANAAGDYLLAGVPNGSYVVSVTPSGTPYAAEYFAFVGGVPRGTTDRNQATQVVVAGAAVSGVDFSLGLGGVIEGTVRDEGTAAPIPNVDVYVNPFTGSGLGFGATTDAAGHYRIDAIPPGSYRVQARDRNGVYVQEYYANSLFFNGATSVSVTASSTATIDFDLAPGGEVRGTVFQDVNGNNAYDPGVDTPVVGANMNVSDASSGSCCFGSGDTQSQSDGSFRVGGVPLNRTLRVFASPPSGSDLVGVYYVSGNRLGNLNQNSATTFSLTPGSPVRSGVDFLLVTGGSIEGDVYVDANANGHIDAGEGISGANINVSTPSFCCYGNNRTTDTNGHYRVRGIPSHAGLGVSGFRVQANPPSTTDYVAAYYDGGNDAGALFASNAVLVPVTSGANTPNINFALAAGASIEGLVYQDPNDNGQPDAGEPGVAGMIVNVSVKQPSGQFSCCVGRNVTTDANGVYRVRGVPVSPNELKINVNTNPNNTPTDFISIYWDGPPDDRGPTTQSAGASLVLSPGEQRTGINFALALGGSISGTLRDGMGNPIAGYCCPSAQSFVSSLSGRGGVTATDANGLYTIRGLVPSSYRVDTGTNLPGALAREYWNNQPDQNAADPVLVRPPSFCGAAGSTGCVTAGVDFVLTKRPQLASGLSAATGQQGATLTGVQLAAVAGSLAGVACGAPPCTRVEVGGAGVTVGGLNVSGGTLTFDLTIASGAPLGTRDIRVVNDYALEDGVAVLTGAFEVTSSGGAPTPSPERLYVTDNDLGRLRIYGTADNALLSTIDVCCDPTGIALSADGRLAYVAGSDRTIAVVDLEQGAEVFRTTVVGPFVSNGIVATSRYVYTVNRETLLNSRVQIFDTRTWKPAGEIGVGTNPFGLRIDPQGRWLYVANQASNNLSVIDVNPASPSFNTVIATLAFPAGFSPRGVAFAPDLDGPGPLSAGSRAYVLGSANTYLLDTALVLGADPSLAFIDVDGDPTTGLAIGTRTGISPIPTRNGGNGNIEIGQVPGSATVVGYVPEFGQIRAIDLSSNPDRPRFVRTIAAGVFGSNGARLSADGSRLFVSYSGSKNIWALETTGILDLSTPAALSRIDRDKGPSEAYLPTGVAPGPVPPAPSGPRPVVSGVGVEGGGPARSGSAFTLTVAGSGFNVNVVENQPIVWLHGTLLRGTVLAGSTSSSLRVAFPVATPAGDHRVVVTNVDPISNVSSLDAVSLRVELAASYSPSQNVVVSSFGTDQVSIFEPGQLAPVPIATRAGTGGVVVTPDGRAALVNQLYAGVYATNATEYSTNEFEVALIDLDPSSATFRQVVAQLPYVYGPFESATVTPDLADPDGVFAYVPNRFASDTVSVIEPAACLASPSTCREVDVNPAPGTQTYPPGDPFLGGLGSLLPAGLNRIELDATPTNFDVAPQDVAVSPDGGRLYTGNSAAGKGVSIVRTSDGAVIGRYSFDGNRADGDVRSVFNIALSPSGHRVYALALDSVPDASGISLPFLYSYDTSVTNDSAAALVGCYRLPTDPLPGGSAPFKELSRGLGVTPDGATAYTVARLRGELWVLDLTTENTSCPGVAARIPLPGVGAGQLALSADGRLLYISNSFRSEVYVYDVTNRLSPTLVTTLSARCASDVVLQPSFGGPQVGAVFPTLGHTAGGSPVTITGARFATAGSRLCSDGRTFPVCVEFNGAVADNIVVDNSFTIRATTPPGVDGPATIRVTNPDGLFGELAGRFQYRSDLTPPVFATPPYVSTQTLVGCPACSVTAEIRWTTDEASTSRVDYGTTSALGSQVSSGTLVTDHVLTLTGLATQASYQFRATSVDAASNAASFPVSPGTISFTTPDAPDVTPPAIASGPAVSVTPNSALVQWTTNEASSSEVEYDANVDGSVSGPIVVGAAGTSHGVTLTGLATNTRHEYVVRSRDASGNQVASGIAQFQTLPQPDTTPPALLSGPSLSYLSNNLVIVTWKTDEPSTSFINYGVSSVDEQGVIDVTRVTTHILFLTNLLPGTAYGFQFGSTDASGNTFLSANPFASALAQSLGTVLVQTTRSAGVATLLAGTTVSTLAATAGFTTPTAPDTTAPVVTVPLQVLALSFDRVLISVGTDEAVSLRARYGISGLTLSAFAPTFTQSPSLLLAGLVGGATYQLEVVLTDPKGNARTLSSLSFTTPLAPDTTPPVLSGSNVVSITQTGAIVTWTSNEPADGQVAYGTLATQLDRQAGTLDVATSHAVTLSGLQPGTQYFAEARSRDGAGNLGSLGGISFRTAFVSPSIGAVTPNRAAQGESLALTIDGANFEAASLVDLGGDGVSVNGGTVNASRTQILATISVATTATTGSRSLRVINPGSGLVATAPFSIVDSTVPVVTIVEPANGAQLTAPTLTVRGSVSEPATLTVNGVAATLAPDLSFSATLRLVGTGAHRVAATAVDPSGNRGFASVDVELLFSDTTAPTLTLAASPSTLWPPNHEMVPVTVSITLSDDNDPTPTVTLISVSSSEPDDAPGGGDGNTLLDIQDAALGTDDRQVSLRAERAGNGPGRLYTIVYRASDRYGNSVEKNVTVRVPHDQGH